MATSKDTKPASRRGSLATASKSHDQSTVADRSDELTDPDELESKSTSNVHCTMCQRRGRKAKALYYCQDCAMGMCKFCMNAHVENIQMNRHSVSTISKSYAMSPNQGPFPELTEIGSIKFDVECSIRGSAFLPNGELVIADYTNSKIKVFGSDYTHKLLASMFVPKEHATDPKRPKPLDITEVSETSFAFTGDNGCVYISKIGTSMKMSVKRIITVISFERNYGECLGIAFNNVDGNLYIGCSSDREGIYVKVYGLDGELKRVATENIVDTPDFLTFGINKLKLYAADSDRASVYDANTFQVVEQYEELQSQVRDIIVDKYGYLYILALERRTFKSPGSIYRLNPDSGVTKVMSLDLRPSSIAYNVKTNVVAVMFEQSRYIFMYKLVLRTFKKVYENELNTKVSNHQFHNVERKVNSKVKQERYH